MSTTAARLRSRLDKIAADLELLVREVPIRYFDRRSGGVTFLAPDYYYHDRTAEQQARQLALKRAYEEWLELLRSMFRTAPDDVAHKLDQTDKQFRIWLEFGTNWSLQPDANANAQKFKASVRGFYALLDLFPAAATTELIVVPDTNALIARPDPIQYRALCAEQKFTLLLLPTVLAELDQLKNLHRNPDFRDKAEKTIQRIKGWRKQGSLRDGVTVDRSITVKAVAHEPKMDRAPSWLDRDVPDDRLIAGVLEVQAAQPNARVVLVTGDINLLNKAETAGVATLEGSP